MEQQITMAIEHMANSHMHLARIMEAERDIVVHLSSIVTSLDDTNVSFCTKDDMYKSCSDMTSNVVSYLNSIGELEEALAENLTIVMKEMTIAENSHE